mmetsp:Transcript_66853/g.186662  ORF Transcript_66853/g.186662 Transcript_66853/m.186662 type:complete len:232 (-) Transcript_66853:539-1234(-)
MLLRIFASMIVEGSGSSTATWRFAAIAPETCVRISRESGTMSSPVRQMICTLKLGSSLSMGNPYVTNFGPVILSVEVDTARRRRDRASNPSRYVWKRTSRIRWAKGRSRCTGSTNWTWSAGSSSLGRWPTRRTNARPSGTSALIRSCSGLIRSRSSSIFKRAISRASRMLAGASSVSLARPRSLTGSRPLARSRIAGPSKSRPRKPFAASSSIARFQATSQSSASASAGSE